MSQTMRPLSPSLLERLPALRGRLSEHARLDKVTWFQVGGPAEVIFRPADLDDLITFLKEKPADIDVTVIGVGSNLLVRDGGLDGVVIRLGRHFADISCENDVISVGAGALDGNVAKVALENSLSGLEFLSGIPGTIGGALRMNAGAYGAEIKDVLIETTVLSPDGNVHIVQNDDLQFSYRHCGLAEDWIFVSARLKGQKAAYEDIKKKMDDIQHSRGSSQPIRSRTGGSTFANPEGMRAWELIDQAGCRGLQKGGAQVSEQHCNFLINNGEASAQDLEELGEEVKAKVKATSGIELRWEIKRIGKHKGEAQ